MPAERAVETGKTAHTEAVRITFDPAPFTVLEDPSHLPRPGSDGRATQYPFSCEKGPLTLSGSTHLLTRGHELERAHGLRSWSDAARDVLAIPA